jgi:hypothetical protein
LVDNNAAQLNELNAVVMDGTLTGNAVVAFNSRGRSAINADFSSVDLGKLAAVQSGACNSARRANIGRVDLTFAGTDYRTTSGTITASIIASAGSAADSKIPVNGEVRLAATNGLFNVDQARLNTDKSELTSDRKIRSQKRRFKLKCCFAVERCGRDSEHRSGYRSVAGV